MGKYVLLMIEWLKIDIQNVYQSNFVLLMVTQLGMLFQLRFLSFCYMNASFVSKSSRVFWGFLGVKSNKNNKTPGKRGR